MLALLARAALSGLIVAAASEVGRRSAGLGGLIASLPLVSLLGMIWLWHDTGDPARLADYAESTLWFVLSSLPMFVLVPWLLRTGHTFWTALGIGCVVTVALYSAMAWLGPRFGLRL